jgi:phosphoribosylformimino-5-aminoimidazole carboxamide ribotide isomerase
VELIAAIDLLGGRSVRLIEGDYGRAQQSRVDPTELAGRWVAAGVRRLHLVDLDGARSGRPVQLVGLANAIRSARRASSRRRGDGIQIQVGGGLRSPDAVEAILDAGADAAVLGTAALERPGFLAACAARWPGRILAAIDLRDGRIALDGWRRTRNGEPVAIARDLLDDGAAGLLVTDTRRDGTLTGPNLELLAAFRTALPEHQLLASGGVRTLDDLRDLQRAGMDGAIVGMALLTGAIDPAKAVTVLAAVGAQP